ncbi:MAG: hypothetical protein HRT89_23425, partial [Lentisphaeria bacterium]|nr:hypothetical protein [Lentisphaeria bacterium]
MHKLKLWFNKPTVKKVISVIAILIGIVSVSSGLYILEYGRYYWGKLDKISLCLPLIASGLASPFAILYYYWPGFRRSLVKPIDVLCQPIYNLYFKSSLPNKLILNTFRAYILFTFIFFIHCISRDWVFYGEYLYVVIPLYSCFIFLHFINAFILIPRLGKGVKIYWISLLVNSLLLFFEIYCSYQRHTIEPLGDYSPVFMTFREILFVPLTLINTVLIVKLKKELISKQPSIEDGTFAKAGICRALFAVIFSTIMITQLLGQKYLTDHSTIWWRKLEKKSMFELKIRWHWNSRQLFASYMGWFMMSAETINPIGIHAQNGNIDGVKKFLPVFQKMYQRRYKYFSHRGSSETLFLRGPLLALSEAIKHNRLDIAIYLV